MYNILKLYSLISPFILSEKKIFMYWRSFKFTDTIFPKLWILLRSSHLIIGNLCCKLFCGNGSCALFNLEKMSARYSRVSTIACPLFFQTKIVFHQEKWLVPLSTQRVVQMLFLETTRSASVITEGFYATFSFCHTEY